MYRTSARAHFMGTGDLDILNNSSVSLSIEAKVSSFKDDQPVPLTSDYILHEFTYI